MKNIKIGQKAIDTYRKIGISKSSFYRLLEKMGFHTYILDGIEQIGGILDEIQTT